MNIGGFWRVIRGLRQAYGRSLVTSLLPALNWPLVSSLPRTALTPSCSFFGVVACLFRSGFYIRATAVARIRGWGNALHESERPTPRCHVPLLIVLHT